MNQPIGIDLGTTNSVIAVCDETGRPSVVENTNGETITPSVIAIDDGSETLVIGEDAAQLYHNGLAHGAAFFKRQMGITSSVVTLNGKEFNPTDLSAFLLEKMVDEVEASLGYRPRDAVVTVPAYFQNSEREATRDAARKAGLNCLRLINEPTAAAIAFRVGRDEAGGRILVYDLGGGTFDVTILDTGDVNTVLQSNGDPNLGGADWDNALFEMLFTKAEMQLERDIVDNPRFRTALRWEAEVAKKRLSQTPLARLAVSFDGEAFRSEVSRADFEEATSSMVERTIEITQTALDRAGYLSPDDIGSILLVGGSTRMPMIEERLTEFFGKLPKKVMNPDHAVAQGAALMATAIAAEATDVVAMPRGVSDLVAISDITNFSLGVIATSEDATRYVNSIMIPMGASLPAEGIETFDHVFRAGDSPSLELFVTQGEGEAPDGVRYLGYYTLDALPGAREGVPSRIEIGYTYDASGIGNAAVRLAGTRDWTSFARLEVPYDVPSRFLKAPPKSQPATVMIWIDVSGSMGGSPIDEAKAAAKSEFADSRDLDGAKIGIGVVSDRTIAVLEPTTNRRALRKAIDKIDTNFQGAGYGNLAHPFAATKSLLSREGAGVAVVLADGVWSNQSNAIQKAKECKDAGINIACVAFGGADLQFLHEISSTRDLSLHADFGNLKSAFGTIARRVAKGGDLTVG